MVMLKQKMLWIGVAAVLVVLAVFGLAMMGSVVGAKPQNIPVALVVEDTPADLPGGERLAVGVMLQEKLLANAQLPVEWVSVASEAEARAGLDGQAYYGVLVLPADLSAGVLSLASQTPQPAAVRILVNEGMNTQAATAVRQILQQATKAASLELSRQALAMLGAQTQQVPVAAAQAALAPFAVQEETVHPFGANNASGNAPGLLTQVMWIGALVAALFLFVAAQRTATAGAGLAGRPGAAGSHAAAGEASAVGAAADSGSAAGHKADSGSANGRKWGAAIVQAAAGLVIAGIVAGFLIWMAGGWYGMELAAAGDLWLFLWLVGAAFFLLQSSLLNWLGFPAMGILVLLMFFSMPIVNMAPEFMPQATQDWLYSWTPLRFAASGIRNVMYFDGAQPLTNNGAILWSIAGLCLVLLLASALRPSRTPPAVKASARAAGATGAASR